VGPSAVLAAVLGAEGVIRALAFAPTSETLWFLNVSVFGVVRWSEAIVSAKADIGHFQLCGGLAVFLMACYGLFLHRRLMLAIASNLSFVYASLLLYAFLAHPPVPAPLLSASLMSADHLARLAFFGCTLLSFATSHIIYVCTIANEFEWRAKSILRTHS
jgi:hypothetical protein